MTEIIVDPPLKEKVTQGAKFLDHYQPLWFNKIDTSSLDMRDMNLCVLGQIFGNFGPAISSFKQYWNWILENGFSIPYNENNPIPNWKEKYDYLTKLWLNEISSRKNEQPTTN